MLIDYIKEEDLIRCQVEADTWEEVVKKGCDLLVASGHITEDYYPAIIKMTEEHGPYFVLMPGVAMPHSRPEAGVLKKGISIMTLKKPVVFNSPDNDPVNFVITLAATDNQTHLGLMQDMVVLLEDTERVEKIMAATTEAEIRELLS